MDYKEYRRTYRLNVLNGTKCSGISSKIKPLTLPEFYDVYFTEGRIYDYSYRIDDVEFFRLGLNNNIIYSIRIDNKFYMKLYNSFYINKEFDTTSGFKQFLRELLRDEFGFEIEYEYNMEKFNY